MDSKSIDRPKVYSEAYLAQKAQEIGFGKFVVEYSVQNGQIIHCEESSKIVWKVKQPKTA